jgi:hypothetical protein
MAELMSRMKKSFLQTAQTATNSGWARAWRNNLFYKYFNHTYLPTYLPTYLLHRNLPTCLPHQPDSNSILEPPVPVPWTNQTLRTVVTVISRVL